MALLVLALLLAAAGGWYWYQGRNSEPEDEPLLATVRMGSIENTISAAGSLKPSNYVDVGAQVSGQLQKLHVEVGDEVDEGQLLAEIDARVQEARVEASRASIAAQEAQLDARRSALDLARINAERQKRLMAEDATSQLEYDTAMNNLASAEAGLIQLEKQIEQSRASLNSEETQLEFTKIYAPVSGTVVSIEMNEGRTLNANQQAPTILRIADLNTMTVETEISEADIAKVRKGMQVYFTTLGNGNRRWYSTLRQVLPTPTVENNVVLYTGLFDIENSDATLLPEMTTQVYFVSSSASNVLVVPMGALSFIEQDLPAAAALPDKAAAASPSAPSAGSQNPAITPELRERFRQLREAGTEPQAAMTAAQGRGLGRTRPAAAGESSRALVTVVHADGRREQREVLIGLTSRVSAEVLSGLEAGDQVIAGVLQSNLPRNESGNNFRPPFMRFGG